MLLFRDCTFWERTLSDVLGIDDDDVSFQERSEDSALKVNEK